MMLHRSMGRYVKELKTANQKIDKAQFAKDEKLDDKYLLSTSDQHWSAEGITLGCKQLLGVHLSPINFIGTTQNTIQFVSG